MAKVMTVNAEGTVTRGLLKGQKGLVVSYDSEVDDLGIKLSDGHVYKLTSKMVNQEPDEQLTLNLDEGITYLSVEDDECVREPISLEDVFLSKEIYPNTWLSCLQMASIEGKKYIEFNGIIYEAVVTPFPSIQHAVENLENLI